MPRFTGGVCTWVNLWIVALPDAISIPRHGSIGDDDRPRRRYNVDNMGLDPDIVAKMATVAPNFRQTFDKVAQMRARYLKA